VRVSAPIEMLAIIEEQAANVATVRDTGDARFLRMFLPTPFSASGGSGGNVGRFMVSNL
jgi:hypothetical protein